VPALGLKGVSSNVIFLGTVAVVLTYSAYVAEVKTRSFPVDEVHGF
jgi:polar amino acid transport system permease protein